MDLLVERVDVWAATIQDRPGGLARVLATLREAGADLQFIVARRAPEKPGTGVVFVTPFRVIGKSVRPQRRVLMSLAPSTAFESWARTGRTGMSIRTAVDEK